MVVSQPRTAGLPAVSAINQMTAEILGVFCDLRGKKAVFTEVHKDLEGEEIRADDGACFSLYPVIRRHVVRTPTAA